MLDNLRILTTKQKKLLHKSIIIYLTLFLGLCINNSRAQEVSLYLKTAQLIEDDYYEPARFQPTVFWKACTDQLQFLLPALELKQKENQL